MTSPAAEIARRLGGNAEGVCRRYLSNGRREGHYWLVGDIRNTPGRSLYVRLVSSDGGGAAGKWTDAATGDHGDLLDIIAASCGHAMMRETLTEARLFLSLPQPPVGMANPRPAKAPTGSPETARRLWAASRPLPGSLAAHYLARRAIRNIGGLAALRFHPSCHYRPSEDDVPNVRTAWPALIAAATDDDGSIMSVHRTWLDKGGEAKAPVACPRRAMGLLLGNGVRFGPAGPVMAAGEGLETILSLRQAMPAMPMIAGLSGAHLAAIVFPAGLRRLYVARDDDKAGAAALATLTGRAEEAGIPVVRLEPRRDDFNSDLCAFGLEALGASLRGQLSAADAARFLG
ncbi:DUF7146 domain-containing protein [Sphingopyxis sp.]|uniref:DUF7146 domain-containing protein n=1 Tax=Sphingopyxis sp. TaxID=1908224 RepID=UPI002D771414|nr:toprim domain-containing protein [Sphingopyxis sp.]HET6523527.1 toprim domain-containing protein [Sphingopyxis sp.]